MIDIPLVGGGVAIIDDEDNSIVPGITWRLQCSVPGYYYARTHKDGRWLFMHRLIVGAKKGIQVDHLNGDGLDNRRANLRVCTPSQNQANQRRRRGVSRFKGVIWHSQNKKWRANIKVNQKTRNLGSFSNEEDAARAYDLAAVKAWGQFAHLNFPNQAQGAT